MSFFRAHAHVGVALALMILSTACSTGSRPAVSVSPVQATERGEIETIAQMLDAGDVRKAKKRLQAALKRDAHNPSLMLLRDSMERDPRDLLGPVSYGYTVRAGDTIGDLAQRLLGNRYKAHQLARYNGIEGPAGLSPGQVLRIPGEPPRAEPVKRAVEASTPVPRRAVAVPRTAAIPTRPAPLATNPAAARQARSAGLAALNEGHPARAVALLSRAAALDPANPAISRDLQRAQRINTTVKARQ